MFKKPSIQDIIMSPKEIKLKKGEICGEAGAKGKPQSPLEEGRFGTISKGFKERIMRNLRDAAIAASLRFGSIKDVPESPIAANVDGKKGGNENDEPAEEAEGGPRFLIVSREDDFLRCMQLGEEPFMGERTSAILNTGEGVSTRSELLLTLLRIEMKDGGYFAKVAISAPWLREVVYQDAKEGECVVVPSLEEPSAVIEIGSINAGILREFANVEIKITE